MTTHEKIERHEKTSELMHISPQAKRIALIIAVLAALLAVTEVYAENRISYVIKDETKIGDVSTIYELPDRYVVAVLTKATDEGPAKLDDVRDAVTAEVAFECVDPGFVNPLGGIEIDQAELPR